MSAIEECIEYASPVLECAEEAAAELAALQAVAKAMHGAVTDLLALETLYRAAGSPVEADRLRSVRQKLATALKKLE